MFYPHQLWLFQTKCQRIFNLHGNFNKMVSVPSIGNTLPCKSASQIISHHIYTAHQYPPPGNRALGFSFQASANRARHCGFWANIVVMVVFPSPLIFYSYALHLLASTYCFIWHKCQAIPNNGLPKQKLSTFQCSQWARSLPCLHRTELSGAANNHRKSHFF